MEVKFTVFDRLISIDWSGRKRDGDRVPLRIVEWTTAGLSLVKSPPKLRARGWSRSEALDLLTRELDPRKPRTAVALDFAFSLPWGSDREVFGVVGWRAMLRSICDLYRKHGTARVTAAAINDEAQFQGHGPYCFNEGRADFRFFLERGVPYYRATELVVPQAISQWYLGAGATVGFHTITGLACLATLLERRDEGLVNFSVWPQEGLSSPFSNHVLLEGYPAVFPKLDDLGPCQGEHERDAWRMLDWMRLKNSTDQLERSLRVPTELINRLLPDGNQRVRFEGWLLGVT